MASEVMNHTQRAPLPDIKLLYPTLDCSAIICSVLSRVQLQTCYKQFSVSKTEACSEDIETAAGSKGLSGTFFLLQCGYWLLGLLNISRKLRSTVSNTRRDKVERKFKSLAPSREELRTSQGQISPQTSSV
jgi:hypothetical protein